MGEPSLPPLRDLGGIGTGDITVLAQLGLALAAEGRLAIEPGDALPLMSSNAATFAVATLAWRDLRELLDAALGVAALSFHALRGNGEAFAAPLAAARPLSGLAAVSARMRALIAGGAPAARLQDPFGLRCLPPVAGRARTRRSRRCTGSSPWRSTPPPRTRCSPTRRRCTTAASTPPRARSRSTPCGSRWSRSPACRAPGSRT